MKIVENKTVLKQSGNVKLIPDEPDDLWLLYNLISIGDVVSSDTSRKIYTASKNPSRVKIELEIKITAVDYKKDSSFLRLRGKTISCNEHVNVGTFHTVEIEKNKEFNLKKKVWDEESINALKDGCDRTSDADLAVVLMNERSAHMFLVGKSITMVCSSSDQSTFKSGSPNKFFETVFHGFVKHVDFNIVRCVILGSHGLIKEELRSYLLSESQKQKIKSISNNKSRIVLLNTNSGSSGDMHSLKAVLNDSTVMSLIKDTKAAIEIRAFKDLTDILSNTPDRGCYGTKSVEIAQELKAIETLMITDDLFRNEKIETRHEYIELVKSVKEAGGKVMVLHATHVCSEKLAELTGIAAILRFPVPDLDELEL